MTTYPSKGVAIDGFPSPEELSQAPGVPSPERLAQGPVAIIECVQPIPCNPCEGSCPFGAITVGQPITNLPQLDGDRCTGCGQCLIQCPGLAIFRLDMTYGEKEALVEFPFEYHPLPAVGEEVNAVNRSGQFVAQGRVIKVRNQPKQDHTPLVTIAVPKDHALNIRGIALPGRHRNEEA